MNKEKIEIKDRLGHKKAISYLKQLLDDLEKGEANIRRDGQVVTLKPSDLVKIKVKASDHKDREKLSIKLRWHKPGPISGGEGSSITA